MKEYPESSKAMDLIAEHRLRSLHASTAWQSKQDALMADKIASLGAKIEHVLEVSYRSLRATGLSCICNIAFPCTSEKHTLNATGSISTYTLISRFSLHCLWTILKTSQDRDSSKATLLLGYCSLLHSHLISCMPMNERPAEIKMHLQACISCEKDEWKVPLWDGTRFAG